MSITLVGSNGVTVTFPNRASCGTGLVLIPGGTATRSGPGKRNVNLPVRLLNTSAYTIQSPATTVLAPSGRLVLDPAGEPGSKIIPQNADSVRSGSGEWVWLVGSSGTVAINDSTAARTLVIRLDSPVTTGQVTFTMEAVRITSAGWVLVTDNIPAPDTTKLLARPATQIVYYRTDATIRFKDGVTDQAKQAFFAQTGISVLGVTAAPEIFFVRIPDPGTSIEAFDAYFDQLNAMSEVLIALEAEKTGSLKGRDGRFPNDGVSQRRGDWLAGAYGTWSRWAVRLPYAWGCEMGDYGGSLVKIGVLEFDHDDSHDDYEVSSPVLWRPADASLPGVAQDPQADVDAFRRHAVWVTAVATARGDDTVGTAGVMWKSKLFQYSMYSAGRRSLTLLRHYRLLFDKMIADQPSVLTISVDEFPGPGTPQVRRVRRVENLKLEFARVLDSVPGLLIVVASGDSALIKTASEYMSEPHAGMLKAALFRLRDSTAYANRILVVAGTKPGNALWEKSNVITGITDIAAPALDVAASDTMIGSTIPVVTVSGTSFAAPMVAGVAGLLLSMDPTLTPTQVKDYIRQGAEVARYDSLNAQSIPAAAVQFQSFYQLNAYGALQLLSKERPGTPICGYPVVSGGYWVLLQKNGPMEPPTDSISVPGSGAFIGRVSVAQGGRRLAVFAQFDSVTGDHGIIVFNHLGQPLTPHLRGYRSRIFLERGTADVLQVWPGGPSHWYEVRLSEGLSGYIPALMLPDGSLAAGSIEDIDVSPDGRFVSFLGGGVNVQRFSDGVTTAVTETAVCDPSSPCPAHAVWSHDGRKLLVASAITNPDSSYTAYLQPFAVDTSLSGGFAPGSVTTISGRMIAYGYAYTGDDALVYTCEIAANPFGWWTYVRAAGSLQTSIGPLSTGCYGDGRRIANVADTQP